ncbi:MAG: conjugal transfer protein TraG N-terminal domain-containing protein [Endomicrobia bacterium]|nr:conjugal transfer protein TraG N-terminal domain-containing protein [Endomicrobiia bacterium]
MLSLKVLTIEQLFEIANNYLGISSGIAMASIFFVFVASIVKELHSATEGKNPDYRGVIWTTVLVFLAFMGYKVIFTGIVKITESISAMMLNYQKWAEFINLLNETLSTVGNYEIMSVNVTVFLLSLSLLLAITAEEIFIFVRYFFIAALYIIGPLVLVVSIYKPARKVFSKWVLLVTQVLLWGILLRILQGIVVSVGFEEFIKEGDLVITFVLAVTLIISYALIPIVSAKMVKIENISLFNEIILNAKQIFHTKLISENKKIIQKTVSLAEGVINLSNRFFRKSHSRAKETDKENEEYQERTR